MNVALATLFVFIFLIPGVVFFRFYYSNEFSQEYFKSTPFEVVFRSLIPSIIFYLIGIWTSTLVTKYDVDPELIGKLLTNADDTTPFKNIKEFAWQIITFHVILWGLSGFLGTLCRLGVRYYGLDRSTKLFRFSNKWHYIVTGEVLEFSDAFGGGKASANQVDVRFVDALVSTSEGTVIYKGILFHYELSKTGGLESIYLKNVTRRKILDEQIRGGKMKGIVRKNYEIPGELMIIPYDKILNLNITYYQIN